MATIMGFTIIQEDGAQVYSYVRTSEEQVVQNLIPNLISVLQMLAKDVIKSSGRSEIKSLTLADTVYTIRHLDVKTPSRKQNRFHFVLLTELTKNLAEVENILEYLMISFLGYNKGEYIVKLRINAIYQDEFTDFNDFLSPLLDKKIEDVRKIRSPIPPGSFIQGMLNSLSEYISTSEIVSWSDKLISLGQSYVWLSEELSKGETDQIIEKIKGNLSPALYGTLEERVNSQLQ
ncbi:MAG: hypothetical protein ACFFED_03065 [Candidatus Thorarchaeota archaeon]